MIPGGSRSGLLEKIVLIILEKTYILGPRWEEYSQWNTIQVFLVSFWKDL